MYQVFAPDGVLADCVVWYTPTIRLISRDIGDELEELNGLRKDVAYGEPGPELRERDLEDLAIELEEFIDEVDVRISSSK